MHLSAREEEGSQMSPATAMPTRRPDLGFWPNYASTTAIASTSINRSSKA